MSRLIIREPSGTLIGGAVSNVTGALIGRVLADVGGVGTVGVGGSGFCFLGFFGYIWVSTVTMVFWFPI